MSTDYSAEAVVGFYMSFEDFFKPLLKRSKEEFHMEDRFDGKTGKKLDKQEKVVDREAGFNIVINGKEFEGPESEDELEGSFCPEDDVMEAIGEALDCSVSWVGDHYNGCCFYMTFEPKQLKSKKLADIVKAAKEFEPLRKRIKKLTKIDPGPAEVGALMSVC